MLTTLLFLSFILWQSAALTCPPGWLKHGGNCFRGFDQKKDWHDARRHCISENADLATINDAETTDFINKNLIPKFHDVWVGLNDLDKDRKWAWVNGNQKVEGYTNWAKGEPDTYSTQKCVYIWDKSDMQWSDYYCNERYNFLCEKPASEQGAAQTVDTCPDHLPRDEYLQVLDNKCFYFYINEKREYQPARDECRQNGGHLALVKSKSTDNFIWSALKTYHYKRAVWIGLSDQKTENSYENFAVGEGVNPPFGDPSHKREDCVALSANDGKWHDYLCSTLLISKHQESFVCEFPTKNSPKKPDGIQYDCPAVVYRDKYLKVLDNKCYDFNPNSKLPFAKAQETCQRYGGNLASVKTKKVNDFIWQEFKNTYGHHGLAWIGLKDENEKDSYIWRDGSEMEYENFAVGEGTGAIGNCVAIDVDSGQWKERSSAKFHRTTYYEAFICEYPAIVRNTTTTPSSTTNYPTTTPSSTTNYPTTAIKTAPSTLPTTSTHDTATIITVPSANPTPTPRAHVSVLPMDTTTPAATCSTIVCEIDCGLSGYVTDAKTRCLLCECDDDKK